MKAKSRIRIIPTAVTSLLLKNDAEAKPDFKVSRIQYLLDNGNGFAAIISDLRKRPELIRPIYSLQEVTALLCDEVLPHALNGKYAGKTSLTWEDWNDLIMTLALRKKNDNGYENKRNRSCG